MDVNTILTIGERMEISVDGLAYKSLLQDILSANTVLMAVPTRGAVPVRLPEGKQVQLLYYRSNGLFAFDAVMQSHVEQDDLTFSQFTVNGEPKRIQRRDSFRLAVSLPVTVRVINPVEQTIDESLTFHARTIDLSEGGMLIYSPENFLTGTELIVDMKLEPTDVVSVKTQVRRCIWPSMAQEPYRIGLHFVDPQPKIRRKISRFILSQQIKFRQRL